MRNIFKKSLLIIAASMMAGSIFSQVQSFTAAEIKSGTQKGAVSVSTDFNVTNKQMCKENSKGVKLDAVEGGNSAGNVGEKYVQISSTAEMSKIYLHATFNSSGSGKKMAFIYWKENVTPADDNVLKAELISFPGYDGACDANYVTVTPPSDARIVRIYRQVKNFDGTGYKKGSTYGENTTFLIADIDVTAGPAPKSTDATLSDLQVDGVTIEGFSSATTSYNYTIAATATTMPTVTATKHDSKASDPVITQATMPTAGSPTQATVTVTAEDGSTTMTYTITFTRAELSHDATLKAIMVDGNAIQGFSPNTKTYNVTVPYSQTTIPVVTATPNFSAATYDVTPPAGVEGTATIVVTAEDGTTKETYTVNITKAAPSTDASLKSLSYSGTAVPGFSPSQLNYSIDIQSGSAVPVLQGVANHSFAKISYQQATSLNGTATATVTAEDGTTTQTYSVTFKEIVGPPVPQTDLMIHYPEVYEAKDIAGGYNTPLTVVGGREYEVYYTQRTTEGDYPTFATTTFPEAKSSGISGSTSKTENVGRAGDTWFKGTITEHSECKNASSQDEFVFETKKIREHRLSSTNTYQFHVKGYDQFSFWGMDKKLDSKNGNQVFVVKIDGVEQPMEYSTDKYSIRRFNITTARHLIEISTTKETGTNKCAIGGFSLRVAQEPRTKYLKGNDSTQRVLQTQAIQPIVYVTKYNSIPGAETKFEWLGAEATGIYLAKPKEGGLTDTLTISGTAQCPVGTYKYAVVAYYNGVETSRAEGKFTVATDLQAMTELNVEVYQNEEMDQIKFRYYALDETAVQLTWPNGQPAGIFGRGAANNTYIIGGTPTAPEGLYPYEITAVGADTTFKGTIRVKKLDYGANPVLYLYKNTGADEKDYVYTYLASRGWNMISRKAKEDGLRPADQYAKYKWILISEDADANNEEVLAVVRGGANLPVLNMNAFTYAYERNDEMPRGWGEPDNGSISQGGCYITVQRNDHPIFKALKKKRGDKIQILDTVTFKGMMPINILLQGTLCLATSPTRDIEDYEADGKMQTIIHEIPATMRGGAKYIAFPIAKNSTPNLTDDGKKVLNAVVTYLTNNESTVTVPTVQITSFTLNGIAGDIDQINKTIKVNIDRSKYPDINLKEAQPVVTLASDQTTVSPASGETVDLSTSAILPVKYEVTDFINRCVYNVTVTFYSPEGIDEVYAVGDWVNVYDIFGRKIATTNEDIYTMPLPRGVYVIVTESGQTLKITR